MKVLFTPTARAQFLAALDFIRRDNPSTARHFRRRPETLLKRLVKFPNSGRVIPEYPDLPQREIIVSPYRFFYHTVGSTVWIVAVWYSAQLPGKSN